MEFPQTPSTPNITTPSQPETVKLKSTSKGKRVFSRIFSPSKASVKSPDKRRVATPTYVPGYAPIPIGTLPLPETSKQKQSKKLENLPLMSKSSKPKKHGITFQNLFTPISSSEMAAGQARRRASAESSHLNQPQNIQPLNIPRREYIPSPPAPRPPFYTNPNYPSPSQITLTPPPPRSGLPQNLTSTFRPPLQSQPELFTQTFQEPESYQDPYNLSIPRSNRSRYGLRNVPVPSYIEEPCRRQYRPRNAKK